MNNERNRNTIIVVIVLVLFAIVGIISGYRIFSDPNRNIVQMQVPTVNSTLQASDGATHQVNINFVVSMDKKLNGKINSDQMHTTLSKAMNELQYNELQDEGNIDYIKELAMQYIEQDYPIESIEGIYIQAIRIDGPIEAPSGGTGDSNIMKGLFQNMD